MSVKLTALIVVALGAALYLALDALAARFVEQDDDDEVWQ